MADEPEVICELVVLDRGTKDELAQLVQYENTPRDLSDKDSCLRYLRDCGHHVEIEPHDVVGPGDDPAVSWGDLSDIAEPRDG